MRLATLPASKPRSPARRLLVRRSRRDPTDLAYYMVIASTAPSLRPWARRQAVAFSVVMALLLIHDATTLLHLRAR